VKYVTAGYDVVSVDPRGLGETRMAYNAASPDESALAQLDFDRAYTNPLSGVLADYVYNSIFDREAILPADDETWKLLVAS